MGCAVYHQNRPPGTWCNLHHIGSKETEGTQEMISLAEMLMAPPIKAMEREHAAIDAHAAQAQAEGKAMAQHALDEIANRVGFYNRSDGQVRRYEKAKKENKNANG